MRGREKKTQNTHRCQVSENGYRKQGNGVEETDHRQENPACSLFASNLVRRHGQILPDLHQLMSAPSSPKLNKAPHDVFRIWCQGDSRAFDTFAPEHVGYDVRVGHCSHRGKPIVFGLAGVNPGTIFFYGTLGALEFSTVRRLRFTWNVESAGIHTCRSQWHRPCDHRST